MFGDAVCSYMYRDVVCSYMYGDVVCSYMYGDAVCSYMYGDVVYSYMYGDVVCSYMYGHVVCSYVWRCSMFLYNGDVVCSYMMEMWQEAVNFSLLSGDLQEPEFYRENHVETGLSYEPSQGQQCPMFQWNNQPAETLQRGTQGFKY